MRVLSEDYLAVACWSTKLASHEAEPFVSKDASGETRSSNKASDSVYVTEEDVNVLKGARSRISSA